MTNINTFDFVLFLRVVRVRVEEKEVVQFFLSDLQFFSSYLHFDLKLLIAVQLNQLNNWSENSDEMT